MLNVIGLIDSTDKLNFKVLVLNETEFNKELGLQIFIK